MKEMNKQRKYYLKEAPKKLSGKEQAKLNKRKKFYEKLERLSEKFLQNQDLRKIIAFSSNKGISFPEYDDLSLELNNKSIEYTEDIDVNEFDTVEITYLEEAKFLTKNSNSKLYKIFKHETVLDNEGNIKKGKEGSDENYDYQKSYNWGIEILNTEKLLELIRKEKENPTIYDMTPTTAKIQEPVYRRYSRPRPRNRS
jgi:hypothetical protein